MTGRAARRSCSLFKRQPGKVNSVGLIRAEQEPAGRRQRRRRGGGERNPGPLAEALSRDPEVTFGSVSLTEVTPRLSADWAGPALEMTFEFLTSLKCHFSVRTARMNKERKKKKEMSFSWRRPGVGRRR